MRRSGSLAARLLAVAAVLLLAVWLALPGDDHGASGPIDEGGVAAEEPRLEGRPPATTAAEPAAGRHDAPSESPPPPFQLPTLQGERPAEGVRVSGRVLLAGTDAPIAGATVMAWTHEKRERTCDAATTDAEGAFTLDPVAARQRVWIVASAEGLHPAAVGATLSEDEDDLVIHVGAGGTLEGRVTQADGAPASGADVWLIRPGIPLPPRREPRQWFIGGDPEQVRRFYYPRAVADEDGRYVFHGVPVGADRLPVVRLSFIADVPADPVRFEREGESQTRDVTLPALASLEVRVLDAGGAVLPTAQIDVESARIWFDASEEGQQSEDGSTTVEGLVPGTWTIRAWLPTAGPTEREVVLAPGAHETVVIQAPAGSVLEGQVVDARGEPVAMASITFTGPASRLVHADAEGRFRLTGLPAAPGTLEVSADATWSKVGRMEAGLPPIARERPLATVTLSDVEPGHGPVRVVLPDGGWIRGRIRGVEAGTKLSGFVLSRRRTGAVAHLVREDGAYCCNAADPGLPCLLLLTAPDGRLWMRTVDALAAGEDYDLGEIVLAPGVDLQGRVVGEDGAAIENARVRLTQRWTERETRTDANGKFRIPGLPRARVWTRIDAHGYPPAIRVVAPGTGTPQETQLSRGGTLELRVLDADDAPVLIGDFSILWAVSSEFDVDHDGLRDLYRLDPSGTTRLRREAATYRLHVSTESHDQSAQIEVEVREGETTAVEVRLTRTPR